MPALTIIGNGSRSSSGNGDTSGADALCTYFNCQVGDLFEHLPEGGEAPE
ncbi:helix-turn-helix transcriptional regulator [Thioalkalivibrio sp. AKL10]|nr:helix-turn-helix transcriptional regulator [Thioalkalivibrio sp. AKL10]